MVPPAPRVDSRRRSSTSTSSQGLPPRKPSPHSRVALCHRQGEHHCRDNGVEHLSAAHQSGAFTRQTAVATVSSCAHTDSAATGLSCEPTMSNPHSAAARGHEIRLSSVLRSKYTNMSARSTGSVLATNGLGLAAAAEEDDYDADDAEGAPQSMSLPHLSRCAFAICIMQCPHTPHRPNADQPMRLHQPHACVIAGTGSH